MRIPARGLGRPRKWNSPLVQWRADIPQEDYELAEEERLKLGLSRAEWFHWMLRHVKLDVMELIAKVKHQEEYIKQLEREKQALLEEREKLLDRIEKLQLKLEAYEKGKAAVSSRSTKIINALVKVIEEGKTFADTMIEIGIEHPQEQLSILKDLFITKDEYGNIASVFYPLKTLKKLKGWVLFKGKDNDMLNYVWAREDTLKAAKDVRTEPKPASQPVIFPEKEVEKTLQAWLDTYVKMENDRVQRRNAESYLRGIANNGLRQLVRRYGFDVVAKVVGSNADYRAVFGPYLEKLRIVEVKA